MLVWKYFIFGAILAGLVALYLYIKSEEKKDAMINKLTSKRLERLLEQTSMRIGERQRELNRTLTEEEKNVILDECYMLSK